MSSETIIVACPACGTLNRVPSARLAGGGSCGHCHRPLFDGRPVALGAAALAKHMRGDLPLLVDVWAPWCGPCRAFAPVFERAAPLLEPRVRLVKVDSDAEPDVSARFQIRSIPTLLMLHRGREVARASGAMPLTELLAWTERNLPTQAA